MSDNKKYYYLKLKENFYDSEAMIILESMQDGYLYSNILMKLYLRSLKDGGKLMFNNMIPYTPVVLAKVVRHQVGTVEKALNIFRELGLIEILDNGAIYMSDIQNLIGKSTTEADRKKEYRKRINSEKELLLNSDGQKVDKCPDKRTPEIEIEIEIEKDNNNEQKNLLESFEIIWKEYPHKKGKSKAYKCYLQWIKGRKISGITRKLTNRQMWCAVKDYQLECIKSNIEQQYIKHGDTFFNSAILDYVKEESEYEWI